PGSCLPGMCRLLLVGPPGSAGGAGRASAACPPLGGHDLHPGGDGDGAGSVPRPTRRGWSQPDAGAMTAHTSAPPPPTTAAAPVLSTRGLTKTYGMTTALAGVDVDLRAG